MPDDEVMILLSNKDYTTLLIALGYAAAAAEKYENVPLHWEFVKLANQVNRHNPKWTPYAIPKEYQ